MQFLEAMKKVNDFLEKLEKNRPSIADWVPKSWKQLGEVLFGALIVVIALPVLAIIIYAILHFYYGDVAI